MVYDIMRLLKSPVRLMFVMLVLAPMVTSIDFTKAYIYDLTPEQLTQMFGRIPPTTLTEDELKEITGYRFDADTFKVLAVPVEWDDRLGTVTRETLDSLMFSRNVWPKGSVADYYYECSYGQLN